MRYNILVTSDMSGQIYDEYDNEGVNSFARYLVSAGLDRTQLREFSKNVLGRRVTRGVSKVDIAADIARSPAGIEWFKNARQFIRNVTHDNRVIENVTAAEGRFIAACRHTGVTPEDTPALASAPWYTVVTQGLTSKRIDELYRRVDPQTYGEYVIVADINVDYRRKRERNNVYTAPIRASIRARNGSHPTERELRDAYELYRNQHQDVILDSKSSDERPEKFRLGTIYERYKVQPAFDWAQRAHYGSAISYMSMAPNMVQEHALSELERAAENKCAYTIAGEDLKMTEAEISAFVGKPVTEGLTPNDLNKLYESRGVNLYLFDLNDTIIMSNVFSNEERKEARAGERVFVIILANQHAIRPSDEVRKRLMKVTADKKPEAKEEEAKPCKRDVNYHVAASYWEAEEIARRQTAPHDWRVVDRSYEAKLYTLDNEIKATWAANGFNPACKRKCAATRELESELKRLKIEHKKAVEFAKKEARYDQPITNIYVNAENFNDEYKALVCNLGYVYASDIDASHKVTHIKYSDFTNIYANTDFVGLRKTADSLDIMYKNQNIQAIGRRAFKTFSGKKWEASTLSTALTRILEAYPVNAWNCNMTVDLSDSEEVAAVDYFRNYTSIARSGEFYTAPLMADIRPYDMHPIGGEPHIYYVETKESQLFDGNGVYDYKVVSFGLTMGLIKLDDIKLQIRCIASKKNNDILKGFIDMVYDKVANDSHRKAIVNTLIGSFGTMHKFGARKSFIVDSLAEASYYYRTNNTTHPRISKLGELNGEPVWLATAEDQLFSRKSNELIRRAIVQRGRMYTFVLMLEVAKSFPVVQIKTDAVYYVKPIGSAGFKADNTREFGSSRTERVSEEIRNQKMWMSDNRSIGCTKVYDHANQAWAEPLGRLSKTAPFDPERLMALPRAFIDGPAGTGKSFILKGLSDAFTAQGLRVRRCAFTNAAAKIIDGVTTHNLFGISRSGVVGDRQMRDLLGDVDVILIDEVSMVPECIYKVLTQVPGHIRVFGFGDFNQHKPVEENANHDGINYRDTSMFKSIFDYNLVVLQKQFRVDKTHADACLAFYKAAEASGVEVAIEEGAFPEGIRQALDFEEYPLLNICYTNRKRREINMAVARRLGLMRSSPNRRVHVIRKEKPGCVYATEHYDARKMMYIINHPEEFKEIFDKAHQGLEDPLTVAKKYFANSYFTEDGMGHKRVEYYRASAGRGRWIPSGSQSLAYITRGVRHIVANDYYVDIDCVNCHPVILLKLCKDMGVSVPKLTAYIEQRDTSLAEVMAACKCDRDMAKKVLLATINGGDADYKRLKGDKCKFLKDFRDEMYTIQDAFMTKHRSMWADHIKRRRDAGKWEGSDEGSFVNMFLIEAETKILDTIVKEMRRRQLLGARGDDVVLCADGLMVPKDERVNADLFKALEAAITRATGFVMTLSKKEMTPKELPAGLKMPRKSKEMADMMDQDLWDEFEYLAQGMPVIADENNTAAGYNNNERYIVDSVAAGFVTVVDVDDAGRRLVIDERKFRLDFRPAYAITSHKAQGATIRATYGIHEITNMDHHGAYVAITRTADPRSVILFS